MLNFTLPTPENPDCLIITNATGLTGNSISIAKSQGINQIGTTINNRSVDGKDITIEAYIKGPATEYRQLIMEVLVPKNDLLMIFDNKMEIACTLTEGDNPNIERKPMNCRFQFTVYAPYPYWTSLEFTLSRIVGLVGMFKFPVNYAEPHMFGKRTENKSVIIYNDGTVPAPFMITINARGPIVNPRITLVETPVSDKFVFIKKELVTGEVITVDMTTQASPKVTSKIGGVEEDAFQYFHITSSYFMLNPGDNQIQYDADVGEDNLDVIISWKKAFSGAYGDDVTYF